MKACFISTTTTTTTRKIHNWTAIWTLVSFSLCCMSSRAFRLIVSSTNRPRRNMSSLPAIDTTNTYTNANAKRTHPSPTLLHSWCNHTSLDFHSISPEEATEIRTALLEWYHRERRKLPWRGDPPPWQGSTAAAANINNKNKNNNKKKTKGQKEVTDFFVAKKSATSASNEAPPEHPEPPELETAFPITAYGVWVSEIMLQQTRVEAVIPYWIAWMKSFPTVHDLAAATEEQVNAHWAGLGFYRRARLLHQAAKQVVNNTATHGGVVVPDTVAGLLELPGIGRYTASAIASMAHQVAVPVVDGNVCRVLSRLRGIAQHVKAANFKDKHAWGLAEAIVGTDGSTAGDVNQALMELGATYCAPSGTGIDDDDPLKEYYWSTRLSRQAVECGDELEELWQQATTSSSQSTAQCPVCAAGGVAGALEELIALRDEDPTADPRALGHRVLPIAPPKAAKREEVLAVAVLSRVSNKDEEAWLLVRRPSTGLLAGQWEFPAACVWNSANEPKKKKKTVVEVPVVALKERRKALDRLLEDLDATISRRRAEKEPLEHIFSHVRHTMWIEHSHVDGDTRDEWKTCDGRHVRWMRESDMQQVGITSGVKKVLRKVRATVPSKSKRMKGGC